jgi:PST family polysaccharide transporter
MTLRVITWPMGFIILAKGESGFFFWTDLAWTVVNVGLSLFFIRSFGMNGAGMAFFGSYVFHGIMIYPIVRRLSGFRWSTANRRTGAFFLSIVAVVFCGFFVLPVYAAIAVGTAAFLLGSVYSVRALLRLVPLDQVPRPVMRVLERFGLMRPGV